MNWAPPAWLRELSHESMDNDVMSNHYAHPRGRPRLLKAISKHYSSSFENLAKEGRELVNEEIVVTAGANGGTYAALCAHLQPGDEVICFEPFFDQYFATIHFNTGTPKFVPLRPPTGKGIKSCDEWTIDFDELRKAFGPKTKAIIVNTPHNPVGKVFTREELEKIAELCIEFNVLCLADEVYDCMVYDDKKHIRIAGLPGMWERTLTILSGGSESSSLFYLSSFSSLVAVGMTMEDPLLWITVQCNSRGDDGVGDRSFTHQEPSTISHNYPRLSLSISPCFAQLESPLLAPLVQR
jgi:kynurenine aminotransferase